MIYVITISHNSLYNPSEESLFPALHRGEGEGFRILFPPLAGLEIIWIFGFSRMVEFSSGYAGLGG
jgi:hypothetical protein